MSNYELLVASDPQRKITEFEFLFRRGGFVLSSTHLHASWLNQLATRVHSANQTWWHNPSTGELLDRNKGEMICLMHSELSEMMEGCRKSLPDDKLPHRSMEEVELADLIIRALDYAGGFGLDIGGAFEEKMQYNAQRLDHKPEERIKEGGKKW